MAIVKVFRVRCQFRGVLPGIFSSEKAAEPKRAEEEAECQRLYRDCKTVGDLDPDGNTRWARIEAEPFDVPDEAASAFAKWEAPEVKPDRHDLHALSLLPNNTDPSVVASVAAALRKGGSPGGAPGTAASALDIGFSMTGTVTPPAVEG